MNNTEVSLRKLLHEDASHAPRIPDLGARVVSRARSERRRRVAAFGGAAAVVVLAIGIGVTVGQVTGRGDSNNTAVADPRSRALPDSGMTDCQPPRSGADIAQRGFAFDGTVAQIRGASSAEPPAYATVTFTVNEWFKGGDSKTATIIMAAPLKVGEIQGEAGPSYQRGTRLLISGDDIGTTMRAWGCGYTRYFDSTTRSYWRSATK